MNKKVLRMIDANYNRAKEALRVVEDIYRFLYEDKNLSRRAKTLRHSLTEPFKNKRIYKKMLRQRHSSKDLGRGIHRLEMKRKNIEDILFANLQRSKESARVLEELFKIIDEKSVGKFKRLRYNLYSFEKAAGKK